MTFATSLPWTNEISSHPVEEWRIADLNRDGKVDRLDLLIVTKYLRPMTVSLVAFTPLLIGAALYVKHKKKEQPSP